MAKKQLDPISQNYADASTALFKTNLRELKNVLEASNISLTEPRFSSLNQTALDYIFLIRISWSDNLSKLIEIDEIIAFILNQIDEIDEEKKNLIASESVRYGFLKTLDFLFESGFSPNAKDKQDRTLLEIGRSFYDSMEPVFDRNVMINYLLDKGADPLLTPGLLHYVALYGDHKLFIRLVDEFKYPLDLFYGKGSYPFVDKTTAYLGVKKIYDNKYENRLADATKRNNNKRYKDKPNYKGITPAQELEQLESLRLNYEYLSSHQPEINIQPREKKVITEEEKEKFRTEKKQKEKKVLTPEEFKAKQEDQLFETARIKNYSREIDSKIGKLIEKGLSINAQNKDGQTALHIHLMRDPKYHDLIGEYITLLLENGIDVNIQDNNGNTALHVATNPLCDYIHILEANPNIHLKNNEGVSVFDVLKNAGYYDAKNDSYQHRKCKELIDKLLINKETTLPPFKWNGIIPHTHKPSSDLQIKGTIKIPHRTEHIYNIGDDMVCIQGDIPKNISCIDIITGELLWTRKSDTFSYWIYDKGIIYFGARVNGKSDYWAIEARTGKELWNSGIGNTYHAWKGTGAFDMGTNIVFATNASLIALDKKKGKKVYKTKLDDYNLSVKAIVRGNEFIIQASKKKTMGFYHYDMTTGELLKHTPVKQGMPEVHQKVSYLLQAEKCWYISEKCYLCVVDLSSGRYNEYKIDVPKGFLNYRYTITEKDNTLELRIDNHSGDTYNCTFDLNTNKIINTEYLVSDRERFLKEEKHNKASKKLYWEHAERILYIDQKPFEMPDYRGDSRINDAVELENKIFLVLQSKGLEYGTENISLLHLIY